MNLRNSSAYTQEIVNPFSGPETHRRLKEAGARLGWRLQTERDGQLVYHVGLSWSSWGETVTVFVSSSAVRLASTCCCGTQLFDWGKNRLNCEALIRGFEVRACPSVVAP